MNDVEFHGRLRSWLRSEAPAQAPDWLVTAVLDETATSAQRVSSTRWFGRSLVPALLVVGLLLIAGIAMALGLPRPPQPIPTPETTIRVIPVEDRRLLGIALGPGGLWAASSSLPGAVLIDPATGERLAEVRTNEAPPPGVSRHALAVDLIAAFDSIWTVDDEFGTLTRIGTSPPHRHVSIEVGSYPRSAAEAAGAVWVLSPLDGTLSRIDPATNSVTTVTVRPRSSGSGAGLVAGDDDAIWVALDGDLLAVDPQTEEVRRTVAIGAPIVGLAVDDDVWITSPLGLSRIDPSTGRVEATFPLGESPGPVAVAGGLVWVADVRDDLVRGLDPATGEIAEELPIGRGATDISVSGSTLAVLSAVDRTVTIVELP